MKSFSLPVVVALLAIGVDIGLARLGYGLLLPAIRADLGGSYGTYGLIGALHLAGYLGGTLTAPPLLRDRARIPRVIAVTHVVVALSVAASAAAAGVLSLLLARVVIGYASGIGVAAVVTEMLERVPVARRGLASGIAWGGAGLALVVSAPAGAWALGDPPRWRIATLLCVIPALAIAALALRLAPHEPVTGGAAAGDSPFVWRDLLRARNAFFVAAYAAYGIAYIAYATFAVAAFAARGVPPPVVTAVWAALGLASVAGALAVVPVLAGRGARFSFMPPLAAGALGCWISSWPGAAAPVAGAICVGIGLAATPAVASAFARMRSDAATAAVAFTAVTTVFGAGQLVGPLAAGIVADRVGLPAVPLFAAIVFACGAVSAAVDARLAR
ncbi:MAG: YbfB/YjiJ family MFS transporter [Candidatus Eremiobacteraeota bacterium]|nr:YbfB/YjiJ family MFS transporter [Candidatus Eremiobacteraeota bacterium]